jgi:chaperone modulatory protein CbpM
MKNHPQITKAHNMTPNFIITTPVQVVISHVMEDITELTIDDLCRACATEIDIIIALVNEGVIEIEAIPHEANITQWHFTGHDLRRAKLALRLHRDLGVNFAGAALALQLMDELAALNSRYAIY